MTVTAQKAFRTKLLSYPAVTAAVGQRIYPDVLPQKATMPAMLATVISTRRETHLMDVTRTAHSRIQIECYALTRAGADELAHIVRKTGIAAFRGTVNGVEFLGITIDSGEQHMQEEPTDGNQEHRYITMFDFLISYREVE